MWPAKSILIVSLFSDMGCVGAIVSWLRDSIFVDLFFI
jgi:hypothetical protein